MATDFGAGARRGLRLGPWQVGSLVLMLAGLATIPALIVIETALDRRAMKRAWAVAGRPCPEVASPAANVLGKKPMKPFTYGGVRFERKTGHVDCAAFPEPVAPWEKPVSYRVCQFTGPGLVRVTTPSQSVWYQPGFGRPVTVTVRHGRASCVLGGWFKG